MLDFRTPTRGRVERLSHDRRRLAYLVFAAGLAVVLMFKAANPEQWRWLDRWASSEQSHEPPIDNRIERIEQNDAETVHLAAPHLAANDSGQRETSSGSAPRDSAAGDKAPGANDSSTSRQPDSAPAANGDAAAETPALAPGESTAETPGRSPTKTASESAAAPGQGAQPKTPSVATVLSGVSEYYLGQVRDDTVFRVEEQDSWFNILDVLNRADAAAIARQSAGAVSFAQLYRQSPLYRGRVVSTSGVVRQADHYPRVAQNSAGIGSYYRLTLFPVDHRDTPMFVYCLSLPERFPIGSGIEEFVEVDAVFFKRWVYEGKGGLFTTPILLAKDVRWQPRLVVREEPPAQPWLFVAIVAVAAIFSVAVSVAIYRRTKASNRPSIPDRLELGPP